MVARQKQRNGKKELANKIAAMTQENRMSTLYASHTIADIRNCIISGTNITGF
jgi:hypothetical protein